MSAEPKEVASFRLPSDMVQALRKRAEEDNESVSDLLRRGALLVLGICPTCERKWPGPSPAPDEELIEELALALRKVTPGMAHPGEGDYGLAVCRDYAQAVLDLGWRKQ